MRYHLAVLFGRVVSYISKVFHKGAGGTWAGEVALRIYPNILKDLSHTLRKGVILVSGTNGKTTTSLMIKKMIESQGDSVCHNETGANLLNGVVSSLLLSTKKDWGLFEVDENALPILVSSMEPTVIVLLNLFRDQLDRYGEVDTIAGKWKQSFNQLSVQTTIVANADDPLISAICEKLKTRTVFFGLENPSLYREYLEHATDSIYCPKCGTRLTYGGVYYSHLGKWSCGSCGFTHPDVVIKDMDYPCPMEGMYNKYNTIAAAAVGECIGLDSSSIQHALSVFVPAFGRMEDLVIHGKKVRIVLSKNPTGFNESIRTYMQSAVSGPALILLNDRIPDGTDVSWIWDVDFELLDKQKREIIVSGDRTYDMAVRVKYALSTMEHMTITDNLLSALDIALSKIKNKETLWILATYSAMLDVRKIITGKKIL
jgi:UDP-N-acetylmuramyl tripeptide synthase